MLALFFLLGCSINQKTAIAPSLMVQTDKEAKLQVLGKTSGQADSSLCLGIFHRFNEQNFVSAAPSVGGFSLVEDAAMFHALSKKNADVILAPKYHRKTTRGLFCKTVTVTVSGYAAKIIGFQDRNKQEESVVVDVEPPKQEEKPKVKKAVVSPKPKKEEPPKPPKIEKKEKEVVLEKPKKQPKAKKSFSLKDVNFSIDINELSGKLTQEQLIEALKKRSGNIQKCAKHLPNATGDITVFFVVSPSGKVTMYNATDDSKANDAFPSCVFKNIYYSRFPKTSGISNATIKIHFQKK